MQPLLVGLAGKKFSGKTTAALYLGAGWAPVEFSDPLKRMLRALGLREEQLWGPIKDVPVEWLGGATPRCLMKTIGSALRAFDADILVYAWAREVDPRLEQGQGVVAAGVRYPNEVRAVRKRGGRVLWVERPGLPSSDDEHSSETSIGPDDCDAVIVNDVVPELLAARVLEAISPGPRELPA